MARAMAGWAEIVLLLACMAGFARAQDEPLSVAVFDFDIQGGSLSADTGEKIGDLLTVFLSDKENLQLVDRAQLKKALDDLDLSETGDLDPGDAMRLGSVVGAKVFIKGRATVVGGRLYLAGKILSVETQRMNGQVARGEAKAELDAVVQQLADKLAGYLKSNRAEMVAQVATSDDRVRALRQALAKKNLPAISAVFPARVVGAAETSAAAQAEFTSLMRKVGVPTLDASRLGLDDWAPDFLDNPRTRLPDKASKADVVFVGDGLSEITGRTRDSISVRARLQVKAIDVDTNKLLLENRQTVTVTMQGASAQKLGTIAMRKAAGQAAAEMLPDVVNQWNKQHAKPAADKPPKKADTSKGGKAK